MLTVLSLPDPNAMLAILLQGLSQLGTVSSALSQRRRCSVRFGRTSSFFLSGGMTPVCCSPWWPPRFRCWSGGFFAGVTHLLAKTQQGHANFNQHLGATVLTTAPHLLFALGVIPFVNVRGRWWQSGVCSSAIGPSKPVTTSRGSVRP